MADCPLADESPLNEEAKAELAGSEDHGAQETSEGPAVALTPARRVDRLVIALALPPRRP